MRIDLLNNFGGYLLAIASLVVSSCNMSNNDERAGGNSYYVNVDGNDANDGSKQSPWKSISKLTTIDFNPGDTIYFKGGQTFEGTLKLDSTDSGSENHPVVVTSEGESKATIHGGNLSAVSIAFANNIKVRNLHLVGSGRKDGNVESGLVVTDNSTTITIDSIEIEGFQKSGLLIYSSSDITIDHIHAHDNGAAGISVYGYDKKTDCQNISIRNSLAENNPGDPANLTNHSGNGIIVGLCSDLLIEYCVATNNGWDMPRIGNGPVGIWAYEADKVIIQHCIAYRNKTSKGGEDGGGFDLDGGVTNSVIQYCLSYENDGSGFGIFQYAGASAWKNNSVRFNISENDGLVSTAHSGIYIWNGSNNTDEFTDCYTYNNVIYNARGSAIRFATDSKRDRFYYYNNIFVGKEALTKGVSLNDNFLGNDWWSLADGFNIEGQKNFKTWIEQTGQEKKDGTIKGLNIDPGFENSGMSLITDPHLLESFFKYRLRANSPLRKGGIDLKKEFEIDRGQNDFNQNPVPANGIGASF